MGWSTGFCVWCFVLELLNLVSVSILVDVLASEIFNIADRLSATFFKEGSPQFREAEVCYSVGANRGASALFRSTLEKALKANGYEDLAASGFDKMRLQAKIDKATEDGVITEALRNRAHDEIRVLGNDVLHDDWVKVEDEDVQAAHHYTQRVLEAFYDHRASVEKILIDKNRIPDPANPATTN